MKFEIVRYFSTFVRIEVEASDEDEAYVKAKEYPLNNIDIYNNLEDWEDADDIRRIK